LSEVDSIFLSWYRGKDGASKNRAKTNKHFPILGHKYIYSKIINYGSLQKNI
jgi:hypothetical protein